MSAAGDDMGVTRFANLISFLTVLSLLGCGGGDAGEEATPTVTNLSATVAEQLEQRAVDKGQLEELKCARSTDRVSPEGNTDWFCSFYAPDNGVWWIWEGKVDEDGKVLSFASLTTARNLDPTVTEQVEQQAVDEGKGQLEELRCDRLTFLPEGDTYSPEGNTRWFCSFYAPETRSYARGVRWFWEGTVDKDGKALSFALEKQIPSVTPQQKPALYWSAYSWCKRYRRSFYSPDSAISEFGKIVGGDSPRDVESLGCKDGWKLKTPKVPEPRSYEIPSPPAYPDRD